MCRVQSAGVLLLPYAVFKHLISNYIMKSATTSKNCFFFFGLERNKLGYMMNTLETKINMSYHYIIWNKVWKNVMQSQRSRKYCSEFFFKKDTEKCLSRKRDGQKVILIECYHYTLRSQCLFNELINSLSVQLAFNQTLLLLLLVLPFSRKQKKIPEKKNEERSISTT